MLSDERKWRALCDARIHKKFILRAGKCRLRRCYDSKKERWIDEKLLLNRSVVATQMREWRQLGMAARRSDALSPLSLEASPLSHVAILLRA